MFERILVPLDGSKAAEIVLPYVWEIAAKSGAEIVLTEVFESKSENELAASRAYLKNTAVQGQINLKNYGARADTKIDDVVLIGKPAVEILRHANENNVGLIAMTSRGSSAQEPWLLGNIAAKVLRATSRPVLLIRAAASDAAIQQKKLIKRVLVPLDGSKLGESAIPYAETLCQALDAELVLFHAVEPEPIRASGSYESYPPPPSIETQEKAKSDAVAYLESIGELAKHKGITVSTGVDFGASAECIVDYAKTNEIDIIAMSTHGRSGIGRWVFGSVTDKVLHAGDTAVLVVRAPKA